MERRGRGLGAGEGSRLECEAFSKVGSFLPGRIGVPAGQVRRVRVAADRRASPAGARAEAAGHTPRQGRERPRGVRAHMRLPLTTKVMSCIVLGSVSAISPVPSLAAMSRNRHLHFGFSAQTPTSRQFSRLHGHGTARRCGCCSFCHAPEGPRRLQSVLSADKLRPPVLSSAFIYRPVPPCRLNRSEEEEKTAEMNQNCGH